MWLTIDPNINVSLSRQIYSQIKNMILKGVLTESEKLPSSRSLARNLSVSRNTILESYNQLIAEGYLEGLPGSGTFVAKGIYKNNISQPIPINYNSPYTSKNQRNIIDFRSGVPDLSLFPKGEFGRLYKSTLASLQEHSLQYQHPAGILELRKEIALYLFRARGINCNENNIMITSGSTQGLSLVSKVLFKNNKQVLIENPTHPGLREVISKVGFSIKGINVDSSGIKTGLLETSNNIAFIYTTPSHQYPLGSILPIQRRLELIKYALCNNCYIIEDDYDSEFRYDGHPISSLYELNPEKVIYIGSFSKILAPALRIGYIILPTELISSYLQIKQYSDVHTESLSQHVLSKFINNKGLDKHIFKMKKIYSKRRQHLINELHKFFPNEFEVKDHNSGLHIIVKFYNLNFTKELIDELYLKNVKIYSVDKYDFEDTGNYKKEILLGYGHLDNSQISLGIKLLNETILS